jgi:hypothetical protein
MSARVPDLHVLEPEPVGDDVVVKLLEALKEAQAGKLSAVGIAVVYRDGSTGSSWSTVPSLGTLLGSATLLQARLARLVIDED